MADVSYTTSKNSTAGISVDQIVVTAGVGTAADGVVVLHLSDTLSPAEAKRLIRAVVKRANRDLSAVAGATVEAIATSGATTEGG